MAEAGGGSASGEPPRELSERDLSFVDDLVPLVRALVHSWFRPEVTGFERVPDGPVLFVGNHSGGFGSPDSIVFVLAFLERFGTRRPLYWLGHSLVVRAPLIGDVLRRCGVLEASPELARLALTNGGSVVVYPGGEVELHRPWGARHEIRFGGHTGFVRLAREAGVPLVPVVAAGGHSTYLPLTDGSRVARALGLDRLLRLKVFPVSLSVPWGLDVGGFLPHVPLPAKVRVEVMEPIDVSEWPDDDEAYLAVTTLMQQTLWRLAHGDVEP